MSPTSKFVTVNTCARCGLDHVDLRFRQFVNPIVENDGTVWDWWGMCPVRNEPILMNHLTTEADTTTAEEFNG